MTEQMFSVDVAPFDDDCWYSHYREVGRSTSVYQPSLDPIYPFLCKRYDSVNEVFNTFSADLGHFELHSSLKSLATPRGKRRIVLKCFEEEIETEETLKWMSDNGLRLALPEERESFTRANPSEQTKGNIVDLGSMMFREHGSSAFGSHKLRAYVPVLCSPGRYHRRFGAGEYNSFWEPKTRLLFVH